VSGFGYVSDATDPRLPQVVDVIGWAPGRFAWGPRSGFAHLVVTRAGSSKLVTACGRGRFASEFSDVVASGLAACSRCARAWRRSISERLTSEGELGT